MPRYIDADELKRLSIKFGEEQGKQRFSELLCEYIDCIPTADVVPKSEVERLEEKCAILNEKNAQLALALFRDFPTTKELEVWEACEAVKTKVAREIFEEIDRIIFGTIIPNDCAIISIANLAELKKKYTEEKE